MLQGVGGLGVGGGEVQGVLQSGEEEDSGVEGGRCGRRLM